MKILMYRHLDYKKLQILTLEKLKLVNFWHFFA